MADPFARAEAKHPGWKLVRCVDAALGGEYILGFRPESGWFDLVTHRDTWTIETHGERKTVNREPGAAASA